MRKLFILLFFPPFFCFSQKIENLKAEAQGEIIIITYDLVDSSPGDTYEVSLFSSHDNFTNRLIGLKGDAGKNILGGNGKKIEWNAKAQLGKFKGELSFELLVDITSTFSFLPIPTEIKRGNLLPLTWKGGEKNKNMKIELLRDSTVIEILGSVPNEGLFSWKIPSNQKPSAYYQFQLVSAKETIVSPKFEIKRKYPIAAKVGAAAVGLIILNLLIPKPGPKSDLLPVPLLSFLN